MAKAALKGKYNMVERAAPACMPAPDGVPCWVSADDVWLQAGVATNEVNVMRTTSAISGSVRINPACVTETLLPLKDRILGSCLRSDGKTMRLSWRYNKFTGACKPPAQLKLSEWREILSWHQVELGENVGDDILLSSWDGVIQFSDELIARNPLILLRQSNGQA